MVILEEELLLTRKYLEILKLNSIGRGGRSSSKPSTAPGPGSYQTINGHQKGITIALKSNYGSVMAAQGRSGGGPGPGHYQSTYEGKAPAYTFGLKTGSSLDTQKVLGIPGPGQYNPDASISQGGAHNRSRGPGFGTDKRAIGGVTKSMTEIPGPGQYTLDASSRHGPKIGFGTSTRDKGGIKQMEGGVPGPGQYSYADQIGLGGPKVSMKFRPGTASSSRTIEVPGPGQYNPNLSTIKHHTPGGRIGTSKRSGLDQKDSSSVPGPGHFNVGEDWTHKTKNAGFGASNRYDVARSIEGPGPGNYTLNERAMTSAPAYTMGGGSLSKSQTKSTIPGPGQYNPRVECSRENLGGVKIGTGERGTKYENHGIPGPGNYNVSGRISGPAYGIGSGSRSGAAGGGKADQTPGPGHYKLPFYVAQMPRYMMPDKPESLRYV